MKKMLLVTGVVGVLLGLGVSAYLTDQGLESVETRVDRLEATKVANESRVSALGTQIAAENTVVTKDSINPGVTEKIGSWAEPVTLEVERCWFKLEKTEGHFFAFYLGSGTLAKIEVLQEGLAEIEGLGQAWVGDFFIADFGDTQLPVLQFVQISEDVVKIALVTEEGREDDCPTFPGGPESSIRSFTNYFPKVH